MTKFMNKSFSVYANAKKTMSCDKCGKEAQYFVISQKGQLCYACYCYERDREVPADPQITMRPLGDLGK